MRVLVAGASGAIGTPLVRQLQLSGHEVVAVHRAPGGRDALLAAGAHPVRVDVLDRSALLEAVDGHRCDAVISQLTALRKPPARYRDMAMTNRLRTEGTSNLLAAAERVGATRFVTQSMVFGYGYGDFGDRVLSEGDQFAPTGQGRFESSLAAMRANERQVLDAAHVAGIALRYGLFYGPGAADALVDGVRRRRLPVVRNGGVKPWVHVDDAVAATVAALEHGAPGSAYNIADDEPVSFTDLIRAVAAALDAPAPRVVPPWLLSAFAPYAKAILTGSLRVSTAKAKQELGWAPRFPTYRRGVEDLVAHYRHEAAQPSAEA